MRHTMRDISVIGLKMKRVRRLWTERIVGNLSMNENEGVE